MDGVHDMGGMHGFGKVPFAKNQITFEHRWEETVWGLCQGAVYPEWANLDHERHVLERMPPGLYLSYSYFEKWLYGLTTTLLEAGLVTIDEVKAGRALTPDKTEQAPNPSTADPYRHTEYRRNIAQRPRFKPGDRVRALPVHSSGHTRLPRYIRDRLGTIRAHHGAHVLPDTNAHGEGESPTHLYSVVFTARELWGDEASALDKIYVDVWERHLETA